MNTTIMDEVTESVEPLLTDVISGFISHPEKLDVECARMGGMLQFNIDGHPDDLPKIMGYKIKTLAALRALFGAMLRPMGLEMRIHIADRQHERSLMANQDRFTNKPDWARDDFVGLLQDVLNALCSQPPEVTEQIIEPRKMRFASAVNGTQESIFHIKAQYADLPIFTTDVEVAIELLFRAIGAQQGRRVSISYTTHAEYESQQAVP